LGRRKLRRIWKYREIYFLIIPGLLYFIVFHYIPMYGITIAFQDYKPWLGYFHSEWVGLEYFERFVTSHFFPRLMRNSLTISMLKIVIGFPMPIIFALMLNELRNRRFKRVIQSISYLPHFISWVILYGIFYRLFSTLDGAFNEFLSGSFGIRPIPFLTSKEWFRPMLVITSVWKSMGWGSIIYLAAIAGINPELYETASIDGCGRFRQMWHVTLPGIAHLIAIFTIFTIGSILTNDFFQIFLFMRTAGQMEVGDVIETYTFRVGIQATNYSMGAAVGVFKSVISLVLIMVANAVAKLFGQEGIW
jgi:putative aldouronate transport system permease protein